MRLQVGAARRRAARRWVVLALLRRAVAELVPPAEPQPAAPARVGRAAAARAPDLEAQPALAWAARQEAVR